MKALRTRCTAAVLAAIQAIALFSCGNSSSDLSTDSNTPNTPDSSFDESSLDYSAGLPDMDFKGYEFTLAVRGVEGAKETWDSVDIIASEQNGDVLNDAVYDRNSYMYDKFNVKINVIFAGNTSTKTSGSDMYNFISKAYMSGDNSFDAIISSPYDTVGYAISGFLADLNSLEYLDLSKPWWDQNANSDLSFGKKVFFTTGELTYIDNKATQVMLFNKKLAEDYKIQDPYQTVRDGKWTLDKLISDSNIVTNDVDGNSIYNEEDTFGYSYWQDGCFGLLHSTGNSFGKINSSGTPELTLYTERTVETWDKLISFLNTDNAFSYKNDLQLLKGQNVDYVIQYMLEGDHTLYSFGYIFHAIMLRISDVDFGIIPLPKFDEEQDRYYSTAHGYGTALMSVPNTSDKSRTGFILEALCTKSMELVTPAFYEKTLKGKSIRDDDSAEMLDLIFATKKYDIGYFFLWGDLTNKVMNAWNALDPNFTSMYKAAETAALEDVKKTIELFE